MIRCLAAIMLFALVAASPLHAAPKEASAVNDFGFELVRTLSPQGNLFVSPLSISAALALTMEGARGETRSQMGSVLHLDDASAEAFGPFVLGLADQTLKIANAIWVGRQTPLQPAFKTQAQKSWGAEAAEVDFSNGSAALETINRWVAAHTDGHIQHLLERLDATTQVVLTNAVFFQGRWKVAFDPKKSAPAPFYCADGSTPTVPMMHGSVPALLAGTRDMQVMVLPYDGPYDMVILVPSVGSSPQAIEKSLSDAALRQWMAGADPATVELTMPRFKLTCRTKLEPSLQAMGMKRPFEPNADFSAMLSRGASISEVIHQADLDVDESGTTAAAATAVVMTRSVTVLKPLTLDHPFDLLIVHRPTRTVVFMGRVADPR